MTRVRFSERRVEFAEEVWADEERNVKVDVWYDVQIRPCFTRIGNIGFQLIEETTTPLEIIEDQVFELIKKQYPSAEIID